MGNNADLSLHCFSQEVSSAYHAAQNPERRIFDVLLHGSGYEPDLPESPLLTTEPKLAGPELDSQTSATHLQMATYLIPPSRSNLSKVINCLHAKSNDTTEPYHVMRYFTPQNQLIFPGLV
ncbi:unnamed protein product [Mesocestoides corti]|uniref:Uncharacterized protein n=1 Tax=Mesocestoides corti TaxID=53468 RepID=A0A0R3UII3_MESCO|nr:unnamed protein product [Mesocestoides corti]